jgi:hypothetical protein
MAVLSQHCANGELPARVSEIPSPGGRRPEGEVLPRIGNPNHRPARSSYGPTMLKALPLTPTAAHRTLLPPMLAQPGLPM